MNPDYKNEAKEVKLTLEVDGKVIEEKILHDFISKFPPPKEFIKILNEEFTKRYSEMNKQ